MKAISCLFLFLFLSFLKCASVNKIETDIIPIDTFQTQILNANCASIMSNNFVIAVEEIKQEQLQKIIMNKNFIKKNVKPKSVRMPKLLYFKIALENTGNFPLSIEEITLQYDNMLLRSLNAEDLKDKYNSLAYSGLMFDEILSLFKFDAEELCAIDIDFSDDPVKYKGPVLSGDKVFQIIAFNWLPVEIRKFNLSIAIKSDIIKKIIDFKLMRLEYRRSGEYFIKPAKEDIDF